MKELRNLKDLLLNLKEKMYKWKKKLSATKRIYKDWNVNIYIMSQCVYIEHVSRLMNECEDKDK